MGKTAVYQHPMIPVYSEEGRELVDQYFNDCDLVWYWLSLAGELTQARDC